MGTVTVSTCSPREESDEVSHICKKPPGRCRARRQPVHLYVSQGPLLSHCTNVAGFTLRYNEEHLLMTDALPSVRQILVEENTPVKIDYDQQPVQLAFLVRVMPRCTLVTVGPYTSLSLLLNIGCLHVEQVMVNGAQMFQLLQPPQ